MLLFFDIDGTLFDDRHRMPPSVLPALEKARQNGHYLFVNTGRTLCNMDRRLDGFPFDGWVMGCGTRILLRGETIQSMEHSPEDSLLLRSLFLSLRLPVVYECDTAMYFDPESPAHPAIPHFRRFAREHGIAREVSAADPEFRIVKMFAFSDAPGLVLDFCAQSERLALPYAAIDRGKGGWELVPAGYSKASGIDVLCRRLGATPGECFAFGDSTNDLSMLDHVKYSVAMGNAPAEVQARCLYVTSRPEEDGIARALSHFGLA